MKVPFVALLSVLQLVAATHNAIPVRRRTLHRRQNLPTDGHGDSPPAVDSTPPPDSSPPPVSHPDPQTPDPTPTTPAPTTTPHHDPPAQTPPSQPAPGPDNHSPDHPIPVPSANGGAPVNSIPVISEPGASESVSATVTGPPPAATYTTIPPLESLSLGMPTRAPLPAATIYPAGAKPPISGAPPLPTPFVFQLGKWPAQDKVPPTDTPEVRTWMKELDGFDIPDFPPSADGSCVGDPSAAAQAAQRGWWTCGGHVRSTDIVSCPDKNTWGVSFDDGPSGYTRYLLDFLQEKQLTSTFFVVGSRVIERPELVVQEYMQGHEISVHTWSHRPLTSLTNEQVVAELGWTRLAIKTVLGVTPTTMRPPFGDIDDRVRAISLAMGMIPIMWTRTPDGGIFDTDDWRVAAGHVNGTESYRTFESIVHNATNQMSTGFIVLQHDLYEVTVDLAAGYTLPFALSYNPALTLESIGKCINKPTRDLYLESNSNKTFPYPRDDGIDVDGDGTVDAKSGDSGKTAEKAASQSEDSDTNAASMFTLNVSALPLSLILSTLL